MEEGSEEEYDVPAEYYKRDNLESEIEPDEEDLGYHSGATSSRFLSDNEDEEDNDQEAVVSQPQVSSRKIPTRTKVDKVDLSDKSEASVPAQPQPQPSSSSRPSSVRTKKQEEPLVRTVSKELLEEELTQDEPFNQQSSASSSDPLIADLATKGFNKSLLWDLVRQGN
jgi:hypothetical protein